MPSPRSPVITAVTPSLLEPAEETAQLGPQNGGVGERAEEVLDRVDDDPLGADRVDRGAEAEEEPVEVPVAGLLDLRPGRRRRGRG